MVIRSPGTSRDSARKGHDPIAERHIGQTRQIGKEKHQRRIRKLVGVEGLEPTLLAEHDFESRASTNSATPP